MNEQSVLVVCLSPAFQQTSVLPSFREDGVNRARETVVTPAGKGVNVSRVLRKYGKDPVELSQLGGPRIGEFLSLCEKAGIRMRHVDSGRHIRNCVTLVNEECGTSTEIVEENPPVDPSLDGKMMDAFLSEMPRHDILILTGSMAKGFSPDLFARMTKEAKRLGKTVIADIRGESLKLAIPMGPDIIKPNLEEFMETFAPEEKVTEESESEYLFSYVEKLAGEAYLKYGVRSVITRGKYDTWYHDGKELKRMAGRKVKAVNTIGCGDTFTAVLASSFLDGKSLDDAVRSAMDAASERASRKELL